MSIELSAIGTYATGIFDEGAAEVIAYDSNTLRLFVVNGASGTIDVLDLRDPNNPTFEFALQIESGSPNSVAVSNGIVAIAVENSTDGEPGNVVFFDTDGTFLNSLPVGVVPDMLTFTPDGSKVLVANEGVPTDDRDPEGSISIIDISAGVLAAQVVTADFRAFNGSEDTLRSQGVRIFPDRSASEDFEPEYIAIDEQGATAYVTLQENNAVAVVDIDSATVTGVIPLGVKDFSRGLPKLTNYNFDNRPDIDNGDRPLKTSLGDRIELGGFSGLWFDGIDRKTGNLKFLTVPDRGPNGEVDAEDNRPFLLPDYQTRIVEFELDEGSGEITITNQIFLERRDGTPITGLPNIPGVDRQAVDASGNPVDLEELTEIDASEFGADYDPLGADLEGIIRAPDGTFWMVDEYRPAIYHVDRHGILLDRFVPKGTVELANDTNPDAHFVEGTFGTETLPADYLNRRTNRGFEGMAFDTDSEILYAFIQTPLSNPTRQDGDASRVIRMLGIDPDNGKPVSEYVYLLQKPDIGNNVDKIGDAVYAGDGKFFVIERDSSLEPTSQKFVYELDLTGATNVLGMDFGDETLEQQTPDDLAALGITPVNKIKTTNLPSIGYLPSDKPEGLAYLHGDRLAVLNDNDFGLVPDAEAVELSLISFTGDNGLDASDKDDTINIQNHPLFGLLMPDAIDSFEVNGQTYFITANEGDDRGDADEDEFGDAIRVGDLADVKSFGRNGLELDDRFNPAIAEDENLGRTVVSSVDGNLDGGRDLEQLFSYGGRSFSIFDVYGNLVFDSGDLLEQITADRFPDDFNSTNDENGSFDNRSDNKGPEPEGVTVGVIGDRTYAFIGLERIGGIAVYDVSNPVDPHFVQYINNRDFTVEFDVNEEGDPDPTAEQLEAAKDLGPEGLAFIGADKSPNGAPLLAVANEVSGTTTIYQINTDSAAPPSGTIDFESPALPAGTFITDQLTGVTVTATGLGAMLFDTVNPTGGDTDLASETLGNVLILSEDGNSANPDDDAAGGTFQFLFDNRVNIASVQFLDIEEAGGTIELFGKNDSRLASIDIATTTNGGLGTVQVGIAGVSRMDVTLEGSGAIAAIDLL